MIAIFETDRLLVRPWTVEDAEAAFVIFGDPEVMRYVGDTGEPHPDIAFTRERLTHSQRSIGGLRRDSETGPSSRSRPAK